jgi:murein peptide amidase A
MVRVSFAFLATRAARLEARLHNAARHLWHELRLPAEDPSGRDADIGAGLAGRDAAQQHVHVRLTKAGIGAGRAALRAVEARVDTCDQCGGVHLDGSWMRLEQLLSVGHFTSLLALSLRAGPVRRAENKGRSTDFHTCGRSSAPMRDDARMFCRVGCGVLVLALALVLAHAVSGTAAAADPLGHRRMLLGRSVDGRPIVAIETGDFDAPTRLLVVGCIHGSEPAGIAIANRLSRISPPREVDLWIVPALNPDGVAARTRGNARGVDLNRNFPWQWERLSGAFDSGARPLSEPESRIAARLIRRVRPQVSIWFHQHLDLVDESGGNLTVERRFAAVVGLPLRRLAREPGSVVGWENHTLPGTTAFVVELPSGSLSNRAVRSYAHAVLAVE